MATVVRVTDPRILSSHSDLLEKETIGFDPESLLGGGNICLLNPDNDNLVLFEKEANGVYNGHYFLRVGGRQGLEDAKRFLVYAVQNGAQVIKGLTPVSNKKALWFSKKLGFTSLGIIDTPLGDMVLQMITNKEINS